MVEQRRTAARDDTGHGDGPDLAALLADATELGDWPRVGALAEDAALDGGWDARLAHAAAFARWMTAEHEAALDHARRAALTDPRQPAHFELLRRIGAWCDELRGTPFPVRLDTGHGALTLEPLGHHHARAFLRHYDPDTARLCCLPWFDDEEAWHRWLAAETALDDQVTLAVLHEAWGFVGVVNVVVSGATGFFYYWIGAPFRGRRFGPAAVDVALDIAAREWGVETVYAKVYDYNAPSIAGLLKLGFEPLPFQAAPPHDDERFFLRGAARPLDAVREDLRGFLDVIRARITLADPIVGAGGHAAEAQAMARRQP